MTTSETPALNGWTARSALSLLLVICGAACSRTEAASGDQVQASPPQEKRPNDVHLATDAGSGAQALAGPEGESVRYNVPERTQGEVDDGLRRACQTGKESGKPLLIEFSAPWCGDCRRLAEIKGERILADRLKSIPHFAINIGHFDRHEEMLENFGVGAIAAWRVVGTDNCSAPPHTWRRIAKRTLEPTSGTRVDARQLVDWLERWF